MTVFDTSCFDLQMSTAQDLVSGISLSKPVLSLFVLSLRELLVALAVSLPAEEVMPVAAFVQSLNENRDPRSLLAVPLVAILVRQTLSSTRSE